MEAYGNDDLAAGFDFDLRKERKSAAQGETVDTRDLVVCALGAALEFIRSMGKGDLAKGAQTRRQRRAVRRDDSSRSQSARLEPYASTPAAALTAIAAPDGVDTGEIVKEFASRSNAVVADNGQGEMKGKRFVSAHLVLRLSGYDRHLGALEQVLARVTSKDVEYGAAVRAAQQVYAR